MREVECVEESFDRRMLRVISDFSVNRQSSTSLR